MPLKHYSIALLLAAVAGCSLWFWLDQKAADSASAVLAFDASAAHSVDAGITLAEKPAVGLSEAILNDQALAALARQAHLSSATAASQIGEFRSDLELTQPSSKELWIRFIQSDPSQAAANANAVAQFLAGWTPAQSAAAAPSAPQPAAPASAPVQKSSAPPTPKITTQAQSQQNHPAATSTAADSSALGPLADSIGQISSQLSATDRDLDNLAAEHSSNRSDPQAAYTEYKQQQLLKSRVGAAQKKLSDLKDQYANSSADSGVKGRLTTIQQALDSILHGGAPDAHGFAAAGTSAGQLSRERTQLTHAISVIDEQRHAIEKASQSNPSAASSPAPSPSPAAAQPTSSATASSPADTSSPSQPSSSAPNAPPADSGNPAQQSSTDHPFTVTQLATAAPPPPLWPVALTALACGLLYLAGAALANRRRHDEDYSDDYDHDHDLAHPHRFITPNEPIDPDLATPHRFITPDEPVDPDLATPHRFIAPIEPVDQVVATPRRFITPDEPIEPVAASPRRFITPDEPVVPSGDDVEAEEASAEEQSSIETESAEAEPMPRGREPFSFFSRPKERTTRRRGPFVWDENEGAAPRPHLESDPEAHDEQGHESSPSASLCSDEEPSDPLTDRLKQNLSQTEIAKLFEESGHDAAGVSSTEKHVFREH